MIYAGYIYKITIPTSIGLRYYYGRRLSSKVDNCYWGSGSKLKKWIFKHTNGKIKYPCSMSSKIAESIGLKREIIAWGKTVEEVNALEYEIVKQHLNDFDCWNMMDGGKCSATYGHKGHPHSEETKQKLREKNLGKSISEETKKRMSVSHLGQPSPKGMLGKHQSDETKELLRLKSTGRFHTQETKDKIKKSKANVSVDTRKKISDFMKKRPPIKHSEETKQKLHDMRIGSNNPCYGKKWWTNGLINYFGYEAPDYGWYNGRTKIKNV